MLMAPWAPISGMTRTITSKKPFIRSGRGKLPSGLDSGLEKQAHRNLLARKKLMGEPGHAGSLTW
jgi:hypothetical protein